MTLLVLFMFFISLKVDQYCVSLSTLEMMFHTLSTGADISRLTLIEVAKACGNVAKVIAIDANIAAKIIVFILLPSLFFFIFYQ
jgi:hypothetical protein